MRFRPKPGSPMLCLGCDHHRGFHHEGSGTPEQRAAKKRRTSAPAAVIDSVEVVDLTDTAGTI
jgi:hypothetical protein